MWSFANADWKIRVMSETSAGPTGWRVNAIVGGRGESAIQRLWVGVGFAGWGIGAGFIYRHGCSESSRH